MLLKYTHQEEFEKIESIIQDKLSTKYSIIQFIVTLWLIFVGMVFLGLFLTFFVLFLDNTQVTSDPNTHPILNGIALVSALGGFGAIIWLSFIVPLNILGFIKEMKKSFKEIQKILDYYNENDEDYEKIDKIIYLFDSILLFLKRDKKYVFFFSSEKRKTLINWLYLIITDLQSDLSYRISEQKSTLEKAKSEVSTHIHGTDKLNQVSELQRARLDQQIEQFEELQRVLVKV